MHTFCSLCAISPNHTCVSHDHLTCTYADVLNSRERSHLNSHFRAGVLSDARMIEMIKAQTGSDQKWGGGVSLFKFTCGKGRKTKTQHTLHETTHLVWDCYLSEANKRPVCLQRESVMGV